MAFIRGNENLKTKGGEPIDGRRLSGGAVLVNREKFRDLWMKVRKECKRRENNYLKKKITFRVLPMEIILAKNFTRISYYGLTDPSKLVLMELLMGQ